ncbi:MAG: ABC transporter substrate-binding protein [Methanothrix sp.]|jgi:iron complex transport system substrate-binding protein|nr:ABC transporter substrate-binding protein [Methanothrix sp.]
MNKKSFQAHKIRGILMAVFILAAISSMTTAADSTGYPRTIVDDADREITIKMPVEKIIPLDSSGAKMLYLLGAENKIIAVGDDVKAKCSYLPGVKDKQSVGKWHEFDYELIGELAKEGTETPPNIIVLCSVTSMDPVDEIAPALEGFPDISVIGLDTQRMENVTQDLEKLGFVLDKESEVQENIDWYNEKTAQVKSAVKGESKTKVYTEFVASKGTGDLSTYGTASGINKLIEVAGGYNVNRDAKVWSKVSWEWVITENPEIILKFGSVDSYGWTKDPSQDTIALEKTLNEILSRPGADTLSAVKNDRAYIIWSSLFTGFDNIVGAAYLAKTFHPEIGLDPDEISREYMARLGLDLPEDRIMMYPSLK